MAARTLSPAELITRCDPAQLAAGRAGPGEAELIVGQPRARSAIEFGIAMRHPGHHVYVMGPPGSGRRTLARRVIAAQVAGDGVRRSDWAYVNNFERSHQPIALELPAGRGAQLRADMRDLVDDLRTMIPAVFESEEYATEAERIHNDYKERAERALVEVGDEAMRRGLAMIRTPVGFSFAPQKDGEVMSPEVYEALPAEQRAALGKAMAELQEQLVRVLRASMRLRKEHAERVRALNRAMTELAIEHAFSEIRARYAELPRVLAHLDAVRADVIANADDFRTREDEEHPEHLDVQQAALARYEVNLLLDAAASNGAPLVEADLPTYQNLVGRVDHVARFGTLLTDFRLIKPGALHRANGGYLLIDALKLLSQPFAWQALKRALTRREIRMEPLAEMFSVISTVQLEPEPIPLALKVVLVGDRHLCALLQALDPEFDTLFRVVADLDDDLPREAGMQHALARTLAAQARAAGLLTPDDAALARLIDHGARLAGDASRLTARVQRLLDVLHEADHLARRAGRAALGAADVADAIAAHRERAARVHERHREAVLRDILMIATAGTRSGQVNALSVYEVGEELFGAPMRVSATSRIGDGEVIDLQRETELGGPLHAKGVMILASFLAARYSRLQPHSIVATLVFEQTYEMIEGDSASLAELVALLSSIADVPVRQCLAVTGSVNQFGDVQAIGGVNEKIEGFFDICAARGLDGSHGVVLPEANVAHLMLRDEVVEAVAQGRFALHAVRSVDDAIEVLTGRPAGDPARPDAESVNGRIARRLHEYTLIRRGEPRHGRRAALPRHRHGTAGGS